MRSFAKVTVAAAVSLMGLVATAGPAAAFIQPTFRSEADFFHCTGTSRLANLNNVLEDSTPTTWNATPPAQSVTDGAGCAALDVAVVRDTGNVDAFFSGTFTGNLRDFTIRLYNFAASQVRAPGTTYSLKVSRLDIDDATYVSNVAVVVTPQLVNDGATEYVEVSVTGLGYATPVYDDLGNLIDVQTGGLATDDGDGTTEHRITLYVDTDPNQTNSVWVWDTSEVPSGLTFNPDSLATAQIPATLP